MQRRQFLKQTSILAGSALGLGFLSACSPEQEAQTGDVITGSTDAETGKFEIVKTPAEWREILTEQEFAVLREEATERPYTSDLLDEKRKGTYVCAGCALPLYSSETKYDSRTGWPSFWEALPDAVGTKQDNSLFMTRTEVHCRRCGGHQGHVFDDGPPPTGKRHCINGIAMDFVAG